MVSSAGEQLGLPMEARKVRGSQALPNSQECAFFVQVPRQIHRMVAIKLIKAGMNSREVVARFESERQALALMDHPAIAKVFDAGSTPQGAPYFVMEYVAGVPVTTYADARGAF